MLESGSAAGRDRGKEMPRMRGVALGFLLGPAIGGALFGAMAIGNHFLAYLLGAIWAYPLAICFGLPTYLCLRGRWPQWIAAPFAGLVAGLLPFLSIALLRLPSPFGSDWYTVPIWFREVRTGLMLSAAGGLAGGLVLLLAVLPRGRDAAEGRSRGPSP